MDPDELYGIVNNNITSVFGDDRQNYLPSDESEMDIGLGQKLINDDPNTDEFSSLFTCLFPLFSDPKFNLSFGNLQQALPQLPSNLIFLTSIIICTVLKFVHILQCGQTFENKLVWLGKNEKTHVGYLRG